ncbi:MAG: hypothetical protein HRT88_10525 [Lentisphaeraceae bacterium]|nr:hypothetical protein [Lentisphaeraceae bacterium]
MKLNKKTLLPILALALFAWLIWPSAVQNSTPAPENTEVRSIAKSPQKLRAPSRQPQAVKVIPHKKEVERAIKRLDPDAKIDDSYRKEQQSLLAKGYGKFPAVDLNNMNAHKQHVLEALKDPKNNSGSISITGKREKFDLARYKADPSYYLDSVEPGRAFDAAQPGPGVKRLERIGKSSIRTEQSETITLNVQSQNGMPVSFLVTDGGAFQNGLSFITVKAGADGIASTEFTPGSGVIRQVRVRAGSPSNSGTLQWIVNVYLNNETKEERDQ